MFQFIGEAEWAQVASMCKYIFLTTVLQEKTKYLIDTDKLDYYQDPHNFFMFNYFFIKKSLFIFYFKATAFLLFF